MARVTDSDPTARMLGGRCSEQANTSLHSRITDLTLFLGGIACAGCVFCRAVLWVQRGRLTATGLSCRNFIWTSKLRSVLGLGGRISWYLQTALSTGCVCDSARRTRRGQARRRSTRTVSRPAALRFFGCCRGQLEAALATGANRSART